MFRLRVLGGFALEGAPGAPAPPRPQRRGDAVLAVLAVCGDLGCTRDRLLALLWPDSDEARGGQALRDAVYVIRRATDPGTVRSEGGLLRLDPAVVTSDVSAFAEALAAGRHADAVRAYGGPLLNGFHMDAAPEFERWLDGARARLAREYAEALEHLAAAAESAGAWREAAGWWGRAVEHDPLNSHFVLRQVRALETIGDRANAFRAADVHARRLREELDLEPDSEVLANIERIRRGEGRVRPPGAARRDEGPGARGHASDGLAPVPEPALPSDGGMPLVSSPAAVTKRRLLRRSWPAGVAAALLLVAGASGVGPRLVGHAAVLRAPRTAIAVLPCRSLSADTSYAFLAGGLHDELLTRLYKVSSLTVVGRTSVAGYRETSKTPRQIAAELNVGSIAECSVQVAGRHLSVNVEVLDPFTKRALWAEQYDSTLDDALAVQSDIARRIVAAVGATLTGREAEAIAAAPTQSSQAYQFYLQGLDYLRRPGLLRPNLEAAGALFDRALALDSAFAPAHAGSAIAHFALYDLRYAPVPGVLERATRETRAALRLAPDLPEAHLAAGLARYRGRRDVRGALQEFRLAARGAPNDAEPWMWIGIANAALGQRDSMSVAFDRARRLDPRNTVLFHVIGDQLHYLHRYREAIEAYRREAALAPDVAQARLSMAWSYILWKGDLDTLRAVLRDLPPEGDPGMGGGSIRGDRLALLMMERRPDSVLALLRRMGAENNPGLEVNFLATAQRMRGDTAAALAAYAAALHALDARERAHPDDPDVHTNRGIALASLGRRAEALREARWIAATEQYRSDPDVAANRALILALAGETSAALTDLERALVGPSTVSAPMLRLFPSWDPILVDTRFQALLLRYAEPRPL
jgi:DNA-binding SARP family transcriptional activator/TolB-like protein/Flp pilus assembly protein TadD